MALKKKLITEIDRTVLTGLIGNGSVTRQGLFFGRDAANTQTVELVNAASVAFFKILTLKANQKIAINIICNHLTFYRFVELYISNIGNNMRSSYVNKKSDSDILFRLYYKILESGEIEVYYKRLVGQYGVISVLGANDSIPLTFAQVAEPDNLVEIPIT